MSGNAKGPVVQSGSMRDVVINSSAAPMTETQRRWEERQRRILEEEEVQRDKDQRHTFQYVKFTRWRRRFCLVMGVFVAVFGVLGVVEVIAIAKVFVALAFLFSIVFAIGWLKATWILWRWDAGRTIKVPQSRLYW
ncbi:hypothetical protein CG747_12590 [Streptomyces sp. CB02959]|nr:hypothetical protein CG747_12590 [Streptomyces sp. CB02959]